MGIMDKGKELAEQLKEKGPELLDKVEEKAEELEGKGGALGKLAGKVDDMIDKVDKSKD